MTALVTTAQVSGNTTPSTFRARTFLLTLNEVDKFDFLLSEIQKLKSCDYYIASKELAPTTGHEHIHMYIHFESSYKLNKKIINTGVHVDICRGSPKQCIDYVKKDGNVICEHGSQPHQGKLTVDELRNMSIDEVPAQLYNIKKKIDAENSIDVEIDDWAKSIKVVYICGPSGIGKTELAKQYVREHKNQYGTKVNLVKHIGDFWHNVKSNGMIAIYDEFRDSHMKASEFINFIDYNKHSLNTKGGDCTNDYQLIIITSVQTPYEIYKGMNHEAREQWLRRMEIINLYPNNIEIEE